MDEKGLANCVKAMVFVAPSRAMVRWAVRASLLFCSKKSETPSVPFEAVTHEASVVAV